MNTIISIENASDHEPVAVHMKTPDKETTVNGEEDEEIQEEEHRKSMTGIRQQMCKRKNRGAIYIVRELNV